MLAARSHSARYCGSVRTLEHSQSRDAEPAVSCRCQGGGTAHRQPAVPVGGVAGFAKAGSTKSLGGGLSAAIIAALSARSMVGASAVGGVRVAFVISLLLAAFFLSRYARTRKIMPAGGGWCGRDAGVCSGLCRPRLVAQLLLLLLLLLHVSYMAWAATTVAPDRNPTSSIRHIAPSSAPQSAGARSSRLMGVAVDDASKRDLVLGGRVETEKMAHAAPTQPFLFATKLLDWLLGVDSCLDLTQRHAVVMQPTDPASY
ncbi:hypothetical protein QJQ45_024256 [Haematococcus lacustris]|nr:hypothetical protein QJQ45_024256 [Haematococcus lacustris]